MWDHGSDMDENEAEWRRLKIAVTYLAQPIDENVDQRLANIQARALVQISASLNTIARLIHQGYTQS